MGIIFFILCGIIVGISIYEGFEDDAKAIHWRTEMFHTGNVFNMGSIGICGILAVLYLIFW